MIPLIVFAKVPLPGIAKTRIAAVCGTDVADRIYRELLTATGNLIKGFPYHVAYTGDTDQGELNDYFPGALSFFPQCLGTIGDRMRQAMEVQFTGGAPAAIAIGCDCPDLNGDHLRRAILLLEQGVEVVITPALDGGYTLIGCRPRALPVFQATAWSTPDLLRETLAIIQEHKFSCELLPELPDIDTLEDYRQWQGRETHGLR